MRRFRHMLATSIMTVLCVFATASAVVPSSAAALSGGGSHVTTFADSVSDARKGIGLTGGDTNGGTRISNVVKSIINLLSAIVGIAAIIMIIVGGLKYITSNGDANNITSAKNTILYAVIGLVIVAFARVIVRFVIGTAT